MRDRLALSLLGALGPLVVAGALSAPAQARPTDVTGADLQRYDAADVVEHYDTTRFRIFFTRAGKNAIPAGAVDGNNMPVYVTDLGQLYESVLDFYVARGFAQPLSDAAVVNNGGDGRFDVYLLDFGGSADGSFVREACSAGTCEGYMLQENDFVGYHYASPTQGNRVLASHEFFHAVQAAYSADQDSVVAEATAVWSEQQFDVSLAFDLEGFTSGYLGTADHSLDRPGVGPVPAFSYGMAIFFEFLGEKLNVDLVRILWEDLKPGARGIAQQTWLPALVALLPREYSTTFADTLVGFATWNLFTRNRADPSRAYFDGSNYAAVKSTNATLPYEDDTLRVFYASQQVLAFDPAGRSEISAVVLPAAGLGVDSLAPLRLIIAPALNNKIGTVSTRPATDDSTPVGIGNANQVLISLVQTEPAGNSTQGILCVGSPDEVSACKTKNAVPSDMGVAMNGGGGCAVAGRGASSASGMSVVLFVLLAALRLVVMRRSAG